MAPVMRPVSLTLAMALLLAGCAPPQNQNAAAPAGANAGQVAQAPKPVDLPVGQIPTLRYAPRTNSEFGYQIKIEARSTDYTETYQGTALYQVVSAANDQMELKFYGGLKATVAATGPASPPLPIQPGPEGGRIILGRLGELVDSYPLTSLPYALGDLEYLVFEQFPEQPQSQWQINNEISIQQSRGIRMRAYGGPERGGSERLAYTIVDVQPQSVRVAKQYALSTTANGLSSAAEINLTGSGQFTFDRNRGLIESLTMDYVFVANEQSGKESANITMTCQLMSPDQVRAELAPRLAAERESDQLSQQAYEDESYPQFRGLQGNERILAKLNSSDRDTITETLGELAQTPTDQRSPEVAKAIAQHLKSTDVVVQQYAAQALIHWGTSDVEADLIEASKSRESWVAKYARDALEQVRRQSSSSTSSSPALAEAEFRTWRDATGAFEIEAKFLDIEEDNVRLVRRDGKVIGVARAKLSAEDRAYVEQMLNATAASPVAAPDPEPPVVTGPVDLLAHIDPQRDQVQGAWTKQAGNLISPPGQADTLVIRQRPPRHYKLTIVAERIAGNDSLAIGLIVGGRQTMLALEGWGVKASGLNTINGRTADDNETTFRTPVFAPGQPTTIVCTVSDSSVQVQCDGQLVVDWSGDPQQLDLDRRFWKNLPEDQLFVGTWATSFRITKMELEPLAE